MLPVSSGGVIGTHHKVVGEILSVPTNLPGWCTLEAPGQCTPSFVAIGQTLPGRFVSSPDDVPRRADYHGPPSRGREVRRWQISWPAWRRPMPRPSTIPEDGTSTAPAIV